VRILTWQFNVCQPHHVVHDEYERVISMCHDECLRTSMELKLVFKSHPHHNMNCESHSERVSDTELGRSRERHLQPVFFHFFWHRNFNSKNRNFHQFYTPKQNTHTHTHTHKSPIFLSKNENLMENKTWLIRLLNPFDLHILLS
jgi:hypothetical protein